MEQVACLLVESESFLRISSGTTLFDFPLVFINICLFFFLQNVVHHSDLSEKKEMH